MQEPAQTSLTSGPGFVTYDTDAEAQEGHPQRVWVLAGGGSVERHTSLAAGINVWHQLRKQRDIRVRPSSSGIPRAGLGIQQASKPSACNLILMLQCLPLPYTALQQHVAALTSGTRTQHALSAERLCMAAPLSCLVQAELFVLTPLGPRSAEPARRKRLVDKRNDIIKISNNLAHPVDPELTLEEIQ